MAGTSPANLDARFSANASGLRGRSQWRTRFLQRRLARIHEQLAAENNPLKVVELEQRRIDTENALAAATQTVDTAALEAGFVENARAYSEPKGISYAAWRAGGVPAAVLKRSGISRNV